MKWSLYPMNFPDYFADAESTLKESEIVIFGVPYDKTSSFRKGAEHGPKEIRQASWNFETYNIKTGLDLRDIAIHDYGNLDVKNDIPYVMIDKVKDFTSMLLKKDKFPIGIGGEHSITSGIIQAYSKNIAVLSLDAHLDFRDEYEGETYNHACVNKRIVDHINIENIAVIGIRSAEKKEYENANKKNLFYIDAFNIRKIGLKKALDGTKKHLGEKEIYLTLDIDVIDPAYAPGTSTPEPFGLNPFDILEIIDLFSDNLVGFDIVEVCPPYDNGETSLLAAKLIRYVIESKAY